MLQLAGLYRGPVSISVAGTSWPVPMTQMFRGAEYYRVVAFQRWCRRCLIWSGLRPSSIRFPNP